MLPPKQALCPRAVPLLPIPPPTHREPPGVPSGEHRAQARLPQQVPRVCWVTLSKPRVLALTGEGWSGRNTVLTWGRLWLPGRWPEKRVSFTHSDRLSSCLSSCSGQGPQLRQKGLTHDLSLKGFVHPCRRQKRPGMSSKYHDKSKHSAKPAGFLEEATSERGLETQPVGGMSRTATQSAEPT